MLETDNHCYTLSHHLSPHQRSAGGELASKCERWCERHASDAKDTCIEVCSRHAHPEEGHSAEWLQEAFQHIEFVVWFALGNQHVPGQFGHHQFEAPDLSFAHALQKSHPGSGLVVMTDQETQLDLGNVSAEIFRLTLDKDKLGRNAYANYYGFQAQLAYLHKLQLQGGGKNVVFLDMDVLVLDSIAEVFCHSFDYGLTMVDSMDQPVNLGMQFVHKDHYDQAIGFIQDVLERYSLEDNGLFTEGQVALAETVHLKDLHEEKMVLHDAASEQNQECRFLNERHTVCFFPCLRYNYWDKCLEHHHPQPLNPFDPDDYMRHGVKALHFVAWRKAALHDVLEAFLAHGKKGAYKVFAHLPHTEEDFEEWRLQREQHPWDHQTGTEY
ncbi:hypothetical protein WJX72_011317 [[Myrmecia] bisecta]|uniref:Nucleotide-diphospho-sugar transferase domain-containing protein n=1 Tax=[Myrmecia] bisecta TaxID=41462 RepID=A0AAW1QGJ7_9CHLO